MKPFIYLAELVDKSKVKLPQPDASGAQVQVILRIVFGLAGAVAVLIVVIAGLQYVISSGDPQKTAKAKNTILYALIGLTIAIFANVIVTFVIGRIV